MKTDITATSAEQTSEIDVSLLSPGDKVPFDASKDIEIHRDGAPPSDIAQGPAGFTVTWEDGFFIVLTPEAGTLGEAEMPRQVSINSALFGSTTDDNNAVPDYLLFTASHSDNPLPFAPLGPYGIGLPAPQTDQVYVLPEETAPVVVVAPTLIAPPPTVPPTI